MCARAECGGLLGRWMVGRCRSADREGKERGRWTRARGKGETLKGDDGKGRKGEDLTGCISGGHILLLQVRVFHICILKVSCMVIYWLFSN